MIRNIVRGKNKRICIVDNAKGNGTEFKGPGPEEGIGKEKSKRLCVWGDA